MTAVVDRPTTATGPTVRSTVQRYRVPVAIGAGLVLVAAVLGVVSASGSSDPLDPDAYTPSGARAVAELLRDVGVEVERVDTVPRALAQDGEAAVLVVPQPFALAEQELQDLSAWSGPRVVVGPSDDALTALGVPAVTAGAAEVEARDPACGLPAAQRAGDADLGGLLYEAKDARAVGCYATGGTASLLVVGDDVVLGSGDLLTNDRLDERGNASLALGLLGAGETVVWLVPDPSREIPVGAQRPLLDLVADPLKLGVVQLGVAAVVLALWRARRLGRVVVEPLPVVVRAAEAVEGRGRLYRAAGARGTAADALRSGVRDRVVRRLGLPTTADPPGVVATLAARTGRDPAGVDALLYGPAPADDAALVRLADALRDLEQSLTAPPSPTREAGA